MPIQRNSVEGGWRQKMNICIKCLQSCIKLIGMYLHICCALLAKCMKSALSVQESLEPEKPEMSPHLIQSYNQHQDPSNFGKATWSAIVQSLID